MGSVRLLGCAHSRNFSLDGRSFRVPPYVAFTLVSVSRSEFSLVMSTFVSTQHRDQYGVFQKLVHSFSFSFSYREVGLALYNNGFSNDKVQFLFR